MCYSSTWAGRHDLSVNNAGFPSLAQLTALKHADVPGSFICLRIDTTILKSEVRFEPGESSLLDLMKQWIDRLGQNLLAVLGCGNSTKLALRAAAKCCCGRARVDPWLHISTWQQQRILLAHVVQYSSIDH